MQVPQPRTGGDAEFLVQHLIGVLVGPQGLGLTARPVQRQHEQFAQPLPQRVICHHLDQSRDHLSVRAAGHIRGEQLFTGLVVQSLKPLPVTLRVPSLGLRAREFPATGPGLLVAGRRPWPGPLPG